MPAFSGAIPTSYPPANAVAAATNNHSVAAYFPPPTASAQPYPSYVPDVVPQQEECAAGYSQCLVNGPLGYQTLANRAHFSTHSPNPNLALQQIQHSPQDLQQQLQQYYQQSVPGTSPYHSGLGYSPQQANAFALQQQQQFAQSHPALYEYSPPAPPPGLPLHNHHSHGVLPMQLSDARFHTLPVQVPPGADPNLMFAMNMGADAAAASLNNGGPQLLAGNSSSSMNGPLIHAPNALSAGSATSLGPQQQPNVMDMNVNVNGTIARIRLVQFQRVSDEPLV